MILEDRSSGRVLGPKFPVRAISLDAVIASQNSVNLTVATLTMRDGNSLEKVEVVPDGRIVSRPAGVSIDNISERLECNKAARRCPYWFVGDEPE